MIGFFESFVILHDRTTMHDLLVGLRLGKLLHAEWRRRSTRRHLAFSSGGGIALLVLLASSRHLAFSSGGGIALLVLLAS